MQGWGDKDEVLRDLFNGSGGGQLLDVQQTNPPQDLPSSLKQQRTSSIKEESLGAHAKKKMAMSGGGRKKPTTLVVAYLGGVTYMEIAALRFLSKRDSFPYHIVIVTTKVTNGSKLIQSN
jgi:hypothetical protein